MTNPKEEIKEQGEANQAVNPRELYSEIKTYQHSIDTGIASLATHVQEQALSLISRIRISKDKNFLSFEISFARIKAALEDQISGDKDQQWEGILKAFIEAWTEYQSPEDKIRVLVRSTEDNKRTSFKFFGFNLYGINLESDIKNSKVAQEIIKFRIFEEDDFSAFPTVEGDIPIEDKLLVTEAMLNAIQSFFPSPRTPLVESS